MVGTLNDDGGICHASDDAVAADEITRKGAHTAWVLREQTAIFQHFAGSVAMSRRIDLIQSMRQHPDGGELLFQTCPVHMHIHAISQSADHECVGKQARKFLAKHPAKVFAIRTDATRAYDGKHVRDIPFR